MGSYGGGGGGGSSRDFSDQRFGRHSAFSSQYSEPERASSKVSSFGSMQNQSSRSSAPSSSRSVVTGCHEGRMWTPEIVVMSL